VYMHVSFFFFVPDTESPCMHVYGSPNAYSHGQASCLRTYTRYWYLCVFMFVKLLQPLLECIKKGMCAVHKTSIPYLELVNSCYSDIWMLRVFN
jgi:hypothetical protein